MAAFFVGSSRALVYYLTVSLYSYRKARQAMRFERASGVLCHPTSFPGRYGIGDLGRRRLRFCRLAGSARQKLWQVLPLGPTGYGDSPYQSFSAFAGNPNLISPDQLVWQGSAAGRGARASAAFPSAPRGFWRRLSIQNRGCSAEATNTSRRTPGSSAKPCRLLRCESRLAGRLRPVHGPQGALRRRKLAGLAARGRVSASPTR